MHSVEVFELLNTIFLLLRFYVKSYFGWLKPSKISFSAILEGLEFDFGEIVRFFKAQICKIAKLRVSKTVKIGAFKILYIFSTIGFT